MKEELAIVADHRKLKVYLLEAENPALRLMEEKTVSDWTGRFADDVTDMSGAFPSGEAPGQANSAGERHGIVEEEERRSIKVIAETINDVIQRRSPDHWALLAAPELNHAIVEKLSNEAKSRLSTSVKKNLVNAPSATILVHLKPAFA